MRPSRLQRLRLWQRGSSVVVFVAALPMLLLFLCAVIDLGRTVFLNLELSNAAAAVCRSAEESEDAVPSAAMCTEVACAASPSLGADGLFLEARTTWGEVREHPYSHWLYNSETKGFSERQARTYSRDIAATLVLRGAYLTPVGQAFSAVTGNADGTFEYQASCLGSVDLTMKEGPW